MFDEKILDGRSFGELRGALDFISNRIDAIEAELSDGEDDPRLDGLYSIANHIVRRMDSIVREYAPINPAHRAEWGRVMRDYEINYDRYTDAVLEDDTLIVLESPEDS